MCATVRFALIAAASAVVLSACVPVANPNPQPAPPATEPAPAFSVWRVDIDYRADLLADPVSFVLDCTDPAASTYPGDPAAACAWTTEAITNLRSYELGTICTEQYGGPEIAEVRVVSSDKIATRTDLQRTNGCYIDQWNAWSPLLAPISAEYSNILSTEVS